MTYFAVGSYTHREGARGKGVTIYAWDENAAEQTDNKSGTIRKIATAAEVANPSYLAWQTEHRILYAVSEVEQKMGALTAWNVDHSGQLTFLGQTAGQGRSACHLSIDSKNNRVISVSYSDGCLTTYGLNPEGNIISASMTRCYQGSGPNRERQENAHAHQITPSPCGKYQYICDLGSDTVWMHKTEDLENPSIPPTRALEIPPGYGPRHLAYDHKVPVVYILCELIPKLLVATANTDTGIMKIEQEIDTAAPDKIPIAAPAAIKIHPSGKTLAVSNRFDDTIAVFAIEKQGTGRRVSFADRFDCRGRTPRDITFSPKGDRLFIANQDSDQITSRKFDSGTGLPLDGWGPEIDSGSPVCIVMLG